MLLVFMRMICGAVCDQLRTHMYVLYPCASWEYSLPSYRLDLEHRAAAALLLYGGYQIYSPLAQLTLIRLTTSEYLNYFFLL